MYFKLFSTVINRLRTFLCPGCVGAQAEGSEMCLRMQLNGSDSKLRTKYFWVLVFTGAATFQYVLHLCQVHLLQWKTHSSSLWWLVPMGSQVPGIRVSLLCAWLPGPTAVWGLVMSVTVQMCDWWKSLQNSRTSVLLFLPSNGIIYVVLL